MINFTFSALTLGFASAGTYVPRTRAVLASIWHEALPMLVYSQVLIWGQSCVALATVGLIRLSNPDVSVFLGALITMGLETGRDVMSFSTKEIAGEWADEVRSWFVVMRKGQGKLCLCRPGAPNVFLVLFDTRGWCCARGSLLMRVRQPWPRGSLRYHGCPQSVGPRHTAKLMRTALMQTRPGALASLVLPLSRLSNYLRLCLGACLVYLSVCVCCWAFLGLFTGCSSRRLDGSPPVHIRGHLPHDGAHGRLGTERDKVRGYAVCCSAGGNRARIRVY